jgi:hypothetical protein
MLESGCRPDAVGEGSYGIFQEQNPGDPSGPHPTWSVKGALNPDTATQDMLPDYHSGLSQVSEETWRSRPMYAAEESIYHAERPALHYYESQHWDRVKYAYDTARHITGYGALGLPVQHAAPGPHGHKPQHGYGHAHGHGHTTEHGHDSHHAEQVRHRVVQVALEQYHAWPKGVTDNGNSNPIIAKYTQGRLGPEWAWCSFEATYTLEHAGLAVPRFGLVSDLYNWMASPNNHNWYVYKMDDVRSGDVKVKPGDVVFYNFRSDYSALESAGSENHVGIVVNVKGNKIISIDGNWNDRVSYHETDVHNPDIMAISEYIG